MATEEGSKPPSLNQYPEMILAAITALNDKNGSNKSSILKYIESSYGNLPPGYSALVAHHLSRMKDSGELVMIKNNYMRSSDAPPRRGRGRPPKPKLPLPSGTVVTSPRPRGRPPKSKDPSALAAKKAVAAASGLSPRPRGRPPKKARPEAAGLPRPRGRPPKAKPPRFD
ncbi:HMG-Y-related protein A-like [Magnolia sinica]|uniref:HMG-Y-related protein A-like n=1 Tax=Magnolia sinica TaxID=86752 RepID=UPI00265957A6|nr:HMG-Y-related protein A-like [Magnolia sinica]